MHATELEVRFSDLDPYGHVNHAVYLNYFEMGRLDALKTVGWSLGELQGAGFNVLVAEVTVSFRRPAVMGDRLTVMSAMTELRSASARWEQRVFRGNEELAIARVRNAVTDPSGRPCRGPEGWEERLQPLLRGRSSG